MSAISSERPASGGNPMSGGQSRRVAMIGAGQLARMTHQAAIDLGIELEVLASDRDAPAVKAGARSRIGSAGDRDAVIELAADADVLTLDHEALPPELLKQLEEEGFTVRPGSVAARIASDKLHARRELSALGFPVPRFAEAKSLADVTDFAESAGWPLVLKSRGGGYDGRGVHVVEDARQAADVMGGGDGWLVEEHVSIAREISVLVARRPNGQFVTYPIVETKQRDGICHELVMPADLPSGLAGAACSLAESLVSGIDACGVTAVEMFVDGAGELKICEIAVRPHNSGHATIEACSTSQFHNHLRGILDLPLGSTEMRTPAAAMVNVLGVADGGSVGRLAKALEIDGSSVHIYGKEEVPGRKIGHVTSTGKTTEEALARARAAAAALSGR